MDWTKQKMPNIVERLRICAKFDPDQAEAADEIERLWAAIDEYVATVVRMEGVTFIKQMPTIHLRNVIEDICLRKKRMKNTELIAKINRDVAVELAKNKSASKEEVFVELIVKECSKVAMENDMTDTGVVSDAIKKHFGVA